MKKNIEEIGSALLNKKVDIEGVVQRIIQTGGPTLFQVDDGTGSIMVKVFQGAGKRACPDVEQGHGIQATIEIREHNGTIEGEAKEVRRVSQEEQNKLEQQARERKLASAKVEQVQFMASSPIYEKLKDRFVEIAKHVRFAIKDSRPIYIRHHNDADGYASGMSLSKAIIPLVLDHHGDEKAVQKYCKRFPCAAPFYDIEDGIKDTARAIGDMERFGEKMPLVLIVDNGSTAQDLLAVQHGKIFGAEYIVIDHHAYGDEDVISQEVLVHVNPYLVGGDSNLSAGMICSEIARFINKDADVKWIPAMAALADRVDSETTATYLDIAQKEGFSKEYLQSISTVLDFTSAMIRFQEVREYMDIIFGSDRELQKQLVEKMIPPIREMDQKGVQTAVAHIQRHEIGSKVLQVIDIEQAVPRMIFPKVGRIVGMAHDKSEDQKVVTVGIMQGAITMRATLEAEFSVHDFIDYLKQEIPTCFPEGGGHPCAGSIKFIPQYKYEVVEKLKAFLE